MEVTGKKRLSSSNIPVKKSSKLNVMYLYASNRYSQQTLENDIETQSLISSSYPSLSSSYFLNTSVIRFKDMQLCTNKSKEIALAPVFIVSQMTTQKAEYQTIQLHDHRKSILTPFIIRSEQQLYKLRRESISKS